MPRAAYKAVEFEDGVIEATHEFDVPPIPEPSDSLVLVRTNSQGFKTGVTRKGLLLRYKPDPSYMNFPGPVPKVWTELRGPALAPGDRIIDAEEWGHGAICVTTEKGRVFDYAQGPSQVWLWTEAAMPRFA